jgi:hypothetical protein
VALPPFSKEEKVLALFASGEDGYARWIWEMAQGLPEHLDKKPTSEKVDLSREAFEKAIALAEQGVGFVTGRCYDSNQKGIQPFLSRDRDIQPIWIRARSMVRVLQERV